TEIERLVRELNSPRFAAREKAVQELAWLGNRARPVLCQALRADLPLELRRRIDRVLALLDKPFPTGPMLQVSRALWVLEEIGTPEALGLLKGLAEGNPGTRLSEEAKQALSSSPKCWPRER